MSIHTVEIDRAEKKRLLDLEEDSFSDLKAKEIDPGKLTRTLSAFANADGGDLYIGIDEVDEGEGSQYRRWRGFSDIEAANGHVQALEEFFPLGQHVSYSFLKHSDSKGLVFHVNVGKTPDVARASNGKPYKRRGAQNIPITDEETLRRLKLDKGIESFETRTIDVGLDRITNSMPIINFLVNVVPTAEPEPWLKKQRLIKNGKPTVAGILLFDEEPQVVLPKRCGIKVLRYETRDTEGTRDTLAFDPITIDGNLYEQITESVRKTKHVVQNQKILNSDGLGFARYPAITLHEIITNAVIHRDYSIKTDIQVRIFDDRIEVQSPGRLPGTVTPENILREQWSRNANLVRWLNKFPDPPNKDVGEGLNAAYQAMREVKLKPPEVEESDSSVTVYIRHEPLASHEDAVMQYLDEHREIQNSTAREITGISSENTMKNVFYRLRDSGLIERVPGKEGSAAAWKKVGDTSPREQPTLFDDLEENRE